MDGTYHKFREIMKIVEKCTTDSEIGSKVREYYNTIWKPIKENHIDIDIEEFKGDI